MWLLNDTESTTQIMLRGRDDYNYIRTQSDEAGFLACDAV